MKHMSSKKFPRSNKGVCGYMVYNQCFGVERKKAKKQARKEYRHFFKSELPKLTQEIIDDIGWE